MTGVPGGGVAAKASIALRHLDELSRRADGLSPEVRDLMGEALEELTTTLEELRAAGEELSDANDDLHRAQSELREGRRAYQELFDFAPDGYLITDPYGTILLANLAAARRLGGGRETRLHGKPLTVLVEPDDRSTFFLALQRVRRTCVRCEWSGRLVPRGGGAAFSAELAVVGRPNAEGEATDLLWSVHDRSEAEQFERAIRASEEAFRALAENSPDPIARLDRALRFAYVNAAGERLAGRPSQEIIGAAAEDLGLVPDAAEAWAAACDGALRGHEQAVELPFDAPGGRRWLESLIVPERGPGGEVERLLVVSRDVTGRRDAAQALRDSDDLKSAMLASVSHELRTPLTAIAAAAEALAAGARPDAGELIELIGTETTRLERMVANLLDLSRLRGRAVTPRLEPYPVETMVGSALAAVGPMLGAAEVAVELAEDAPLVMIDPLMCERILVNLLHNAITHGRPPVRVTSRTTDGRVALSVVDAGPGVAPADVATIFQPFVHGGSSSGAGIGLALALALAEAQGAGLEVRRAAGGGACFVLMLARAVVPEDLDPRG